MEKIRLLIAEDNSELSDILTNFFEMSGEIDLCGTARDGEETLTKIEEQTPDVVLLDLVMPRLDGISVLERLREKPPAKMPNIIIASAIGLENVTRRALELGACYYMIKPYNLGDLLRRVRMFAFPVSSASQTAPTARITAEDFQNRLKRALLSLGVPPNVLGFPYIVESAKILADTPGPCSITKLVYPAVAERNGTTADCVESAFCRTICGHLSAQLKNALLYRQLEKELTDRKRLESDLDIIFTESIDFISVINVEGYFRRINPLFAEKLGFTEQELLSHPVYDFLHPDDRSDGIRALEEVIRKGTIRGCRLRYRCKTGGTLYLEMNARYVPFSRKIIAIARDITQQRRIEEEKIALEKSMELERLKTEFFSNLSHEFKTPLNIILSSVQLLQMKIERAGDEKDQEYIKLGRYIQQNAYKLLRLTTNMLDSTKLESGYMPIFPERGDIVECIQTIVQSVEPYAAAKKIRLHFSANLRYSPLFLFDPEKVDRILLNLLSNAVKYTPAGGMIRVSAEDTADHVAVSVSDNGPGIAAELLPEIFEKFRVSESGLIRNDEGSGLGLSIAKALVEMHDGEIGVSSPPGEGCTFRFTLSRHLKSTGSEPLHSWMGDGARQSRVYLEMADLNT